MFEPTRIHRKSNHYISTRREKCLQNIVLHIHENLALFWKPNVFGRRMRWRSGNINRAFISVPFLFSKLLYAPLVVTNCGSLSFKSRPREQLKKKKLLNGSMKILRVDLQKVKDNIKNKIEGYQRVERGNISSFSFCKQFWNIPTPLWFPRNPLRELNGQNIFTWTTLCLQRFVGASTHTKENSSQKLAWSEPFGFLTRFRLEVLLKYDS